MDNIHYNYQNNSLGKSIETKLSEAPVIFVTSKVAPVSTFKGYNIL